MILLVLVMLFVGFNAFWTGGAAGQQESTGTMFREVSGAAGIDLVGRGRGSAWADVDGDGLDDVGIGLQEGGFWLYRNLGGLRFREVTAASGILVADTVFGVNFVDVDNDGDADLFLACGGYQVDPTPHTNHLFLNDGRGRFEEVSGAGGLGLLGYAFSSAWSDIDGDHLLDVFVCRLAEDGVQPDGRLFRNLGGARFEDVTVTAGISPRGNSQQPLFFDAEGDGDPDLFLANRSIRMEPGDPEPIGNQLFLNDGTGRFQDASVESGVGSTEAGFSVATADVDRDGDLDLFVGSFNNWIHDYYSPGAPDWLLLNDGRGRFTEMGQAAGVASVGGSMGTTFFDYDNDGWPDLYVARGGPELGRTEVDLVYRNLGNGRFQEVGRELGIVNRTPGHGVTASDADGDGDLDLLVPSGGMVPQASARTLFFENLGPSGSGVCFQPQGESGNRDAVGARVFIRIKDRVAVQEVVAGSGFASQNPAEAWFGIGDATLLDAVTVVWPGGIRRGAHDVPAGHRMVCLLPVTSSLDEAEFGEADPVTGAAPVLLRWEDPRPAGEGRFGITIRGDQGFLFQEEVWEPRVEVTLAPGRYEWGVSLLDHLGPVSAASPPTQTLVVDSPPETPPLARWAAHPNPFGGYVTLAGPGAADGDRIRVEILDVRGALVDGFHTNARGSGFRLVWDGRGRDGRPVAPGAYWARVETSAGIYVVTMVKVAVP